MPMNPGASGRQAVWVASDKDDEKEDDMDFAPPPGRIPRANVYIVWKRIFYSRDNLVTLPVIENDMDHNREGKEKLGRCGVGTLGSCMLPRLLEPIRFKKARVSGASCSRRTGQYFPPEGSTRKTNIPDQITSIGVRDD